MTDDERFEMIMAAVRAATSHGITIRGRFWGTSIDAGGTVYLWGDTCCPLGATVAGKSAVQRRLGDVGFIDTIPDTAARVLEAPVAWVDGFTTAFDDGLERPKGDGAFLAGGVVGRRVRQALEESE